MRHVRYDAILMDLEMPIMDGFEATIEIRKIDQLIPVIAHTSNRLSESRKRAFNVGFNSYMVKPVHIQSIYRTVARWGMLKIKENLVIGTSEELRKLTGTKILFADDQDINGLLTSNFLRNYGIEVVSVSDGKELFDTFTEGFASNKIFDLILTDINMPNLDGLEATKLIREFQANNKSSYITPIIALTGNSTAEEIRQILATGMDDYFIKGDDYKELVTTLLFWINDAKIMHVSNG